MQQRRETQCEIGKPLVILGESQHGAAMAHRKAQQLFHNAGIEPRGCVAEAHKGVDWYRLHFGKVPRAPGYGGSTDSGLAQERISKGVDGPAIKRAAQSNIAESRREIESL